MTPWKDVEPFLGLIATTIFVIYCNLTFKRRCSRGNNKPKAAAMRMSYVVTSIGASVGFMFLCAMMWKLNVPGMVATTNSDVVRFKADARLKCIALSRQEEFVKAEEFVRNNVLGKNLANEAASKQRKTIARSLQPVVNQIFFRTGTLCSLIPLFLVMVAEIALKKKPYLPTEYDWDIFIPVVNGCVAFCWAVNLGFHFWLRDRQALNCMLLSGHWYTFLHTCFSFSITFGALKFECTSSNLKKGWISSRSKLPILFFGWFTLYLALGFNVLISSQKFHHDSEESKEGIKCVAMVLPFAVASCVSVFVSSLATGEADEVKSPEEQVKVVEGQVKSVEEQVKAVEEQVKVVEEKLKSIKKDQACVVVQEFIADGPGEANVKVGDIVRAITGVDEVGWLEVETSSNSVGFIPYSFVDDTKLPFVTCKPEKKAVKHVPTAPDGTPVDKPALKKAPTREVPNFLADIAGGTRRLSSPKAVDKKVSTSSGLLGSLQSKLSARRAAVTGGDEDDNDDESEWK